MPAGWLGGRGGLSRRAAAGTGLLVAAVLGGVPWSAAAVPQSGRSALPAGFIATVAGGPGGPGPARSVALGLFTTCSAQFAAGHLYLPDAGGLVRTVNWRTGWLRTPIGGAAAVAGDGLPARDAAVRPCGASRDEAGNLLVAEYLGGRVRVVAARSGTFYGRKMKAGDIYTVVKGSKSCDFGSNSGTFCPTDAEPDHHGNLVVANGGVNAPRTASPAQIVVVAGRSGTFYGRKMTAGGSYVIVGEGLGNGIGQARVDRAGNVVVAATGVNKIMVLAEKTGSFYGRKMKSGNLYTAAGTGISGLSGDRGPAVRATLASPTGAAVDLAGNLVIGDTENNRVRVVAARSGRFYGQQMTAGDIYTVAGRPSGLTRDGVRAAAARLNLPASIAVDSATNLILDENGRDQVRVVAERTGRFYGRHMNAGDIYTVAGNGQRFFSGDGGPAASARFSGPDGLAVDGAGDLVVVDRFNLRIRLVAAAAGRFFGQKMAAGDVYTIAGDGTAGFSGDSGPAIRARFGDVLGGVAADGAGNVVAADRSNNRIRAVADRTGTFYGREMTAGDVYTVAGDGAAVFSGDGGPAVQAGVNAPAAVAVDRAGNLVITDAGNDRVRVVAVASGRFYDQNMTAGDIYTVAGNGIAGFSGDRGPAVQAELNSPGAVAADRAGNLLISDNGRVRVVAARTGTFYGVTMTAGDIYTVAGDGAAVFSGDGGPAIRAQFSSLGGLAAGAAGNLLTADTGANRIREVHG
jgi:hypothetical protein